MTDLIELKVNGKIYQVEVEPDTSLLYVLRDELGCLLQYKADVGLGKAFFGVKMHAA